MAGQRSLLGGRSGTLLQSPPLAAVVVAHAGLSGKVHHVVLFTRAEGAYKVSKREGKRRVYISGSVKQAMNSHPLNPCKHAKCSLNVLSPPGSCCDFNLPRPQTLNSCMNLTVLVCTSIYSHSAQMEGSYTNQVIRLTFLHDEPRDTQGVNTKL